MKKSKFTPSQIAKILKEFELGKEQRHYHGSMESAKQRFINGVNDIVAWKPVNSNALNS